MNFRAARSGQKIKSIDWNYNFSNAKSAIEAAETTFDNFYTYMGYMINDIVVSGGAVTPHVSGVTVDITACIAYVNGEFYVLDAQSLNLTVPGAGARTNAVVVDNSGTIVEVLGDTGNPHTPPATTSDQLRLANVYLLAADTIVHADDIDYRLVYTVYDMRSVIDYVNALKVIKAYGLYIYFSAGNVKIGNTFYAVAAGTLLLTNTATNYVFVNNAGAVAANTTGYPTDSIPMATVVCAAGVTGTITDNRVIRINKYLNGDGIVITGSSIAVDLATNPGLQFTSNKLDLKLKASGGLAKSSDGVYVSGVPTVDGIQFPAAQVPSADVNCLDDYEEGTWTPTKSGFTESGGGTVTLTGTYIKIGRQVFLQVKIVCSGGAVLTAVAVTSYIDGFPLTPSDHSALNVVCSNTASYLGTGLIYTSKRLYMPAWTGAADYTYLLSGSCIV